MKFYKLEQVKKLICQGEVSAGVNPAKGRVFLLYVTKQ